MILLPGLQKAAVCGRLTWVAVSAEAGSGGGLQTLFTMAAGGLAGESPHMVAASVMALARLLFEFGGALSGVHLGHHPPRMLASFHSAAFRAMQHCRRQLAGAV